MIYYFSATGNCKHVSERLAEAIEDESISIEKSDRQIYIPDNGMLGIVTPTNWWELPVLVREFLTESEFSVGKGAYVFLVATYGTSPGFCGEDSRRLLAAKGVHQDAAFSVKMPDTWTPMFDLSDSAVVAEQNRVAEQQIDQLIERVRIRETGDHTDNRKSILLKPITDRLLNSERRTKNFVLLDTCVGCGLCSKRCPVQAIEIVDGRATWTKERCALCLRCLHHCPKFAIQYGKKMKTLEHGQYRNPYTKV